MNAKKNRNTLTFEPDPKNADLLKKAKEAGLTQGQIVNEALKKSGLETVRELIAKRTKAFDSLFSNPVRQLGRDTLIAA